MVDGIILCRGSTGMMLCIATICWMNLRTKYTALLGDCEARNARKYVFQGLIGADHTVQLVDNAEE